MIQRLCVGLLLLGLLLSAPVWANIAQPGVWSSGGTGSFSLLYPEDGTSYKKIQMRQELVLAQLYKGYATVKGTYWMYNDEAQAIRLKVGYPMAGDFKAEGGDKMIVSFDSLYQLAAKVNGTYLPIKANNEGWYVWETTFEPKKTTKIEVYFIVNTNQSELIKGYNHFDSPIFSYILQTGSIWKNPIERGLVLVQLKDGLTLNDLKSAQPDTSLAINSTQQLLRYTFSKLTPMPRHNLVLVYSNKVDNFNFKKIVAQASHFFEQLDQLPTEIGFAANEFPAQWIETSTFEPLKLADAEQPDSTMPTSWIVKFAGGGLLILVVGGIMIGLVVKLLRKIVK